MMCFDISQYVLPTRTDSNNGLKDIVGWLDENVGKWDQSIYNRTSNIVREGAGWQIRTHRNGLDCTEDDPGYAVITWHAYIDDSEKATLFALKWIK